MLQQTQVTTVIPYYQRFMADYPDIDALATASEDAVLTLWTGLGYYSRARNILKTARLVEENHAGNFPCNYSELMALPGIGPSTAGAILSLACDKRGVIMDGNVKRVLSRCFAVKGWSGKSEVSKKLWKLAEQQTPERHYAPYTQAIMDLGATLCTRGKPTCTHCPLVKHCKACKSGQQNTYPQSRPRKKKPSEHMIMLIIINQSGAILLRKRTSKGIWQGLWCFPVIHSECELDVEMMNYRLHIHSQEQMDVISHTLTHKQLIIQPTILRVKEPAEVREIAPGNHVWYNMASAPPGGIPVPVKTILQVLDQVSQ